MAPTELAGYLSWRVVPRTGRPVDGTDLPAAIVTIGPPFEHESMPDEVAVLLPTNRGPKRLIDELVASPEDRRAAMLGLFLASPFLNVAVEAARLHRAGVRWIANLPSVVQHDEEFSQQLADVGMGLDREMDRLAQFRSREFRVAAVVADARSASAAAAAVAPDAMIVLPRVADFAAGFPSLRQRSTAVQSVAEAADAAGWSGLLLGIGESREADNESLWSTRLDGLVCRPGVHTGPATL